MVVGSGLIGSAFENYKNDKRFIIFASGVSNSATVDATAFERERKLLTESIHLHKSKTLVYFSTCSIYDASLLHSAYVQHKLAMEELVAEAAEQYIIFRVSNPVGKTSNQHTFFNFFINRIQHDLPFVIWSGAERNVLGIDDMYQVCDYILQSGTFANEVINIANPVNYPVPEIVKNIEQHLGHKARYSLVDKTSIPVIDVSPILPLYKLLGIEFPAAYILSLLQKYYPAHAL